MASKREPTIARAQGKHPVELFQLEACQKTKFNTALFSTMEDFQRHKQNFAQR